LLSVVVVPEAAPVSVIVTPASGAAGRRGRASPPPPPPVDTFPERLNVPPPVGVPVKFTPVTLAPLTVTFWLVGVKT
jgi:hypothetical protein